jgi:outer membrane protein assembly factor BamE (lipoprotein component of BamABCDE complex)
MRRIAAIAAITIMTGCTSMHGIDVSDEDLKRIKVGETTVQQAKEEFGQPTSVMRSSQGHTLVSYSRAGYSAGSLVSRSVMLRFDNDGKLAEITVYDGNSYPR